VGVIGSGTLINDNPVLVGYSDGELFFGQGAPAQAVTPAGPVSSR
jgi:hypothetical protein